MITCGALCNQHHPGFSMLVQLSLSPIKALIVPGVLHVMQAHLSLPSVASL